MSKGIEQFRNYIARSLQVFLCVFLTFQECLQFLVCSHFLEQMYLQYNNIFKLNSFKDRLFLDQKVKFGVNVLFKKKKVNSEFANHYSSTRKNNINGILKKFIFTFLVFMKWREIVLKIYSFFN